MLLKEFQMPDYNALPTLDIGERSAFPEARNLDVAEDIRANKMAALIQKNCSEVLGVYKQTKERLFRGETGWSNITVSLSKTRNYRESKGATPAQRYLLNRCLELTGFTATRDNSIFCTPNVSTAERWGQIFIIFPVDGFGCTWSPQIDDVGMFFMSVRHTVDADLQEKGVVNVSPNIYNFFSGPNADVETVASNLTPKLAAKIVNGLGFQNGNLLNAVKTVYSEIAISGTYFSVDGDYYYQYLEHRLGL